MIKLPPTGIDISQNDLQAQLHQLDFYAGLLKQGFKKSEIVKYFRDRRAEGREPSDHGTSTYDLLSACAQAEESTTGVSSTCQSSEDEFSAQFASPIQSPEQTINCRPVEPDLQPSTLKTDIIVGKKTHAPRQSSLLRFARVVSSDTSDNDKNASPRFSPRSNITYRPRSKTYSYDQSEMDEEDLIQRCSTPIDKLEQLSLVDDVLVNTGSTNTTTIHVTSSLRPEAEPFTPSLIRLNQTQGLLESPDPLSLANSDTSSLPSSPPEVSVIVNSGNHAISSSLPPAPRTPQANTFRTPPTVQPRSQQQFLDGSFTVYNDSVPTRLQPQTPAELDRSHFLNQYNAAYTAPPGMITSSPSRHGLRDNRQASGEPSPTAQATMIRERRQREFRRGLRIEGLRIDRSRTDTRNTGAATGSDVDLLNIWRDDLDADSVGEENFEDGVTGAMLRGMRAVSGNRRRI